MANGSLPIFGGGGNDAAVTQVNHNWARYGAGAFTFWAMYGRFIFRDTVAQMQVLPGGKIETIDRSTFPMNGTSPLQSLDCLYPLVVTSGNQTHRKGMTESRTYGETAGLLQAGPIRGVRSDSTAVQIPLRAGFDPTGMIKNAVLKSQIPWAQNVVRTQILGVLVNGRMSAADPVLTALDGLSLFHASHLVNPVDKTMAAIVQPNTFTLPSSVDEVGWAQVRDKIRQTKDFDNVTLVHAEMVKPTLVMATDEQALFWIRFIGGEKAVDNFHLQPVTINGIPTGISSVSMGTATIVVDPYLLALAVDPADVVKRTFCFPESPLCMAPLIFREEQVPMTTLSGEGDWPGIDKKVQIIVSDSISACGIGDWRNVFEIRTS